MSRVVYLHVGAPKTGTTYLQDRLALNKAELARHGVHYPLQLHASQFRPVDQPGVVVILGAGNGAAFDRTSTPRWPS